MTAWLRSACTTIWLLAWASSCKPAPAAVANSSTAREGGEPGVISVFADLGAEGGLPSPFWCTWPSLAVLDSGQAVGVFYFSGLMYIYDAGVFDVFDADEVASVFGVDLAPNGETYVKDIASVDGDRAVMLPVPSGVWSMDVGTRALDVLADNPHPYGQRVVSADRAGTSTYMLFGDSIWRVTENAATLIAGTPGVVGYAGDGGAAANALLSADTDRGTGTIAVSSDESMLYFVDFGNYVVRSIDLGTGTIDTIVNGEVGTPIDAAVGTAGELYVLYGSVTSCVYQYQGGVASAYVGRCGPLPENGDYGDDGPARDASLSSRADSISLDVQGNLYIADVGLCSVRVVWAGD